MRKMTLSIGLACGLLAAALPANPPDYQNSPDYEQGTRAMEIGQDEIAALHFRAAAHNGDSAAAMILGGLYDYGQGVAPDHRQAAMWYAIAAEAGWGAAMNNLAKLYESGKGVPADKVEALKWYELGVVNLAEADEMRPTIMANRDNLARSMSTGDCVRARVLAEQWTTSQQHLLAAK